MNARILFWSYFFHFHAVFGKKWSSNRLATLSLGFTLPGLRNPGSTTVYVLGKSVE